MYQLFVTASVSVHWIALHGRHRNHYNVQDNYMAWTPSFYSDTHWIIFINSVHIYNDIFRALLVISYIWHV